MKKILTSIITFTLLFTLLLSTFSVPALAATKDKTTPTGIPFDTLEDDIDRFMSEHIGLSAPGTAIAVVKNGEIMFSNSYGLADIENNIPVSSDTIFEYGSISKLFVWVSAMQLVEQGKLDLDTDIRTYLPNDFNQNWKTSYPVTMRNIMNHSSGFGEYTFDLISLDESTAEVSLADAILNAHPKQYFEPGTASVYSNYATALAGYVVECISGQEFYQNQKENIFEKIGMDHTAGHMLWKDNIGILDNKAQGYTKNKQGTFENSGWSRVALYPAGSVNGSLDDLAKFAISLMPKDGQSSPLFQDPNTLSTMLSPSYEKGASGMAHGFFEYDSVSAKAFGHGGNTVSFSTHLAFVPEEQFGIVVLTNASNEFDILFGLHDLLIGNKAVENSVSDTKLADAHTLAGNYISMRRPEKTLMEFASYLSPAKIQATDNNTLTFQMMMFSGKYIQTAPYVFEIVESSHPILNTVYNKLVFKMENGQPVQILIGKGLDLSGYPSHRTPLNLTLNVVTLIISALFFLISPIVLIIAAIRRRKACIAFNKKFVYAQTGLTLCGLTLLINNVALILFMLMNQMLNYSQVFPFGVANYVIALISAVMLVWGGMNFKHQTSRAQKVWFIITGILFVSFVSLLASWNMFVLYF